MKRIQSKLHRIETFKMSIKFHCLVLMIKRYVLDNGVNTLAYFHKNIKK